MSVWSGSRFLLKNHLFTSVYNSTQSHTKKKNKLTCLHPTGLWAFGPTRETKERTRSSNRVIQDVVYRASPKSEAEGPGVTSHPTGRWQAGGSRGLSYKGEKEVTIYGGADVRLAHQLPGEPAEEQVSASPSVLSRQGAKTRPFDSLAWWVVLPSALEQSLPGTGGHTCSGYCWGSGFEREDGSRGKAGTVQRAREPPSWRAWPYTCQTQPLWTWKASTFRNH